MSFKPQRFEKPKRLFFKREEDGTFTLKKTFNVMDEELEIGKTFTYDELKILTEDPDIDIVTR